MNILQAIASGILQGITEFIPVSSSGHLVILYHWLGIQQPQVIFDIFLHIGTLFAVVLFFRKSLVSLFTTDKRLGLFIIMASIPTALIGLLFGKFFESLFVNVKAVGFLLVVTGIWLMIGNWATRKKFYRLRTANSELRLWQALLIGTSQGIAIMPGISRSGATISTGLLCGLERRKAIQFSFLLSVPAVLGALVVKCNQIGPAFDWTTTPAMVVGTIVSCVVGLVSLKFLMALVGKIKFYIFGVYCMVLGLAVMLF